MAKDQEFEQIYAGIHSCQKCLDVFPSEVPRRLNHAAIGSGIVLMAQAPSECGVRKSGVHWTADGHLKSTGRFLNKYLQQLDYSIDPKAAGCTRPYTTNVLHCWPGENGKRDRKPTRKQLENCKPWWLKELELVSPRVIILLGQIAAESFELVCGRQRLFKELLSTQGERMAIGDLSTKRYVVPHPAAPYPGKSMIYKEVFESVGVTLRE